MSGEDDEGDKQFDPSQKKLDDARKKGEVPRSGDLNTAASYGGFLLVASALGMFVMTRLGTELAQILATAPRLAEDFFTGGATTRMGGILLSVAGWVSPWFAVPAVTALLAVIAQKSFVVAPSKLEPKFSRISIVSNAKNKFGRQGLFEFAKSFVKLLIYSVVLGIFLAKRMPEIVMAIYLDPNLVVSLMVRTAVSFVVIVLFIATSIGAIDFFWQHAEHIRKHRMSRKEMTDEAKESEGDPHMKNQRRQRGQEIAMNQMLADVPDADVVIVNPRHYAVALKWSRAPGSAPVCVAKGVDEIAARIRETAMASGVPIHRDPPTARAVFAAVEIGQEIRPEHFRAVAVAIRFAEEMAKKSRTPRKKQ